MADLKRPESPIQLIRDTLSFLDKTEKCPTCCVVLGDIEGECAHEAAMKTLQRRMKVFLETSLKLN